MNAAQSYQPRPLPVTIVPGLPVFDITDNPGGIVVAITEAFCVYRLTETKTLCVARWRDVALGNICPAASWLSADIAAQDQRNAQATLLNELLQLQRLGPLTPSQQAALDEVLVALLG